MLLLLLIFFSFFFFFALSVCSQALFYSNEKFVLFRFYVTFNNLSVILQWCLDVAGISMLTLRVLPH